ncbi:hypothetical protein DIPPA_04257 [Diplonema papillatum]|nr:hypothetical protein DIPPA_04257 [Diplonema papillatum]
MALDESAAKALAEAVATGTGKVLRFPSWEKDAREVVQMKGLFADATDRAGQMRAALGKLGFEDVPQRAAQWHLCWLLSLWEEKVTRTWLKREGVLVEEESSDGEEDTDGEAADGEAAAEEPGVASLLTEMRKEVAALRAELAEAKNGQRPGSAGPGGLAVGLQALKPQAWTTLDGKERAVVYGELARRYAVAIDYTLIMFRRAPVTGCCGEPRHTEQQKRRRSGSQIVNEGIIRPPARRKRFR